MHTPKMYTTYFNQEKNVKVYFVEELRNRSLSPPPSPYRLQDSNKWDRTRSDLGIDSMDKLNNLRARENHHCSQYHILVHLDEMHSEICLYGRCPMKELEQKACFRNGLTSYSILTQ